MFLYCDKTIKVDRDSAELLPWGVPLPDIGGVGFGSSPNLDTKHTIYELFLPSKRGCVALSCGGGFCSFDGAYDSVWDRVQPMTGKYFVNYFQYQEFAGCVCMLNFWFSSNYTICADNYFFPVQVEGKGRSEQWEVFLFCDKTIKVDRDSSEVLPRSVSPPGIWGVGVGSSPYLATDYTIYELCLPSERGMNEHGSGRSSLEREVLRDVRVHGSSCGTCRDVFHSL